jgi:hypothetical protein
VVIPHWHGRSCRVSPGAEDLAAGQHWLDDLGMNQPLQRLRRGRGRPPAALDGAYLVRPDGSGAQRSGEVAGGGDGVLHREVNANAEDG